MMFGKGSATFIPAFPAFLYEQAIEQAVRETGDRQAATHHITELLCAAAIEKLTRARALAPKRDTFTFRN